MIGKIRLTRIHLRTVIQDGGDDCCVFRIMLMSITERFECIMI